MAEPQNFRSAFNGFNRDDVVRYLEFLNSRHESQLSQLRGELQAAQEEAEQLRQAAAATPEPDLAAAEELTRLQAHCAVLEAENARLQAENDHLRESQAAQPTPADSEPLDALRRELEQVTRQRDEARNQARSHTSQELEAYRRAERTERVARQRADQLYHRANGVLADAGIRLDGAAAELTRAADQAAEQLNALQEAIHQSKDALCEASGILATMEPETE